MSEIVSLNTTCILLNFHLNFSEKLGDKMENTFTLSSVTENESKDNVGPSNLSSLYCHMVIDSYISISAHAGQV